MSGNANETEQGVEQVAAQEVDGGKSDGGKSDGGKSDGGKSDGGNAEVDQEANNDNSTSQASSASASSHQLNVNAPISILSIGANNGDVDQSNHANNTAGSFNDNGTGQWIGQLTDQIAG